MLQANDFPTKVRDGLVRHLVNAPGGNYSQALREVARQAAGHVAAGHIDRSDITLTLAKAAIAVGIPDRTIAATLAQLLPTGITPEQARRVLR